MLKLANGHLLLNIVFKSVQVGSCFLVHGHELDLGLHHSHYFIDLVDLVLCKTAISVVEVGAPDVPEEIIAAVLALEGSGGVGKRFLVLDFWFPAALQFHLCRHVFKYKRLLYHIPRYAGQSIKDYLKLPSLIVSFVESSFFKSESSKDFLQIGQLRLVLHH